LVDLFAERFVNWFSVTMPGETFKVGENLSRLPAHVRETNARQPRERTHSASNTSVPIPGYTGHMHNSREIAAPFDRRFSPRSAGAAARGEIGSQSARSCTSKPASPDKGWGRERADVLLPMSVAHKSGDAQVNAHALLPRSCLAQTTHPHARRFTTGRVRPQRSFRTRSARSCEALCRATGALNRLALPTCFSTPLSFRLRPFCSSARVVTFHRPPSGQWPHAQCERQVWRHVLWWDRSAGIHVNEDQLLPTFYRPRAAACAGVKAPMRGQRAHRMRHGDSSCSHVSWHAVLHCGGASGNSREK
jgi:hypothetical protein